MTKKTWFRITVLNSDSSTYNYYGTSQMTADQIAESIESKTKLIKLDNLIYAEKYGKDGFNEWKEWNEWDKAVIPSVFINPEKIISFMQYRVDPRTAKPQIKTVK